MTNPIPNLDRRGFIGLCAAGALASGLPRPALAATTAEPAPHTVAFAGGARVPAIGQGSWHMANGKSPPEEAAAAMKLGVSLGLTMIDTADDYADGRAEKLIAGVIAGQRDKIFLVSKLMPAETRGDGIEKALRASLERLGTDHLDLYLLHFRWDTDLQEAVKGFERVRAAGLTKRWGVSNFTAKDMETLVAIPGGENCATNQVLYNLAARNVENDVIPWCAKHNMPIMAYSPLGAGGKGALLSNSLLMKLGKDHGVGAASIALAWAMRDGRTIVVTETGSAKHVRENAVASALTLSADEIKQLDAEFPAQRAG